MRTVRSVARARNQPRGHLALIVVAVVALLAVLVARANAAPRDDEDDAPPGASLELPGEYGGDPDRPSPQRHLYVPITNAMIERIATFAPPIASVVAAAYRAGGVADDPTPSWRRRSRLAALVPMVSVRAGQNQAWRDVDDPTISHGVGIDVRASWRLDQLLFDRDEPRIAMLDVARRRERRRLAAQAIHLYYDWVAARVAADADIRAELDAQEKAAELDALTAGWFSQALAKRAELR
ncbi:MAG TPA: hypothetical protein VFV99_22190 [Kofleriaceae bacterium]|nr:hypothetical protein [Kofleriaceae bacterium]